MVEAFDPFWPLYTNMYHIASLDGAVSHYMLGLEIYVTTPVICDE